jgi:hypothetical protein
MRGPNTDLQNTVRILVSSIELEGQDPDALCAPKSVELAKICRIDDFAKPPFTRNCASG